MTEARALGYARVVVDIAPAHLDRLFDYAVPDAMAAGPGMAVRVPFGGRRRDAWVVGLVEEPATDLAKVRPLGAVRGPWRWFEAEDLALYRWVAERYAGTLASVLRHALPARVAHVDAEARAWRQPPPLGALRENVSGADAWAGQRGAPPLGALSEHGSGAAAWAGQRGAPPIGAVPGDGEGQHAWSAGQWERGAPPVGAVPVDAVGAGVRARPRGERAAPPCPTVAWRPYGAARLLRAAFDPEPVAVALRALPQDDPGDLVADLVARCLAAGRTALVVVPDWAPGPADAALAVAGAEGIDLRRADDPATRYRAFLRVRAGQARVVVGERAAALLPVGNLGLVVVVDEASPAYKERRAPRHHAREVALARARMAGVPCVLLTDLPSAQAWRHAAAGHLELTAPARAVEREHAPLVDVVDPSTLAASRRRGRLADPVQRVLGDVVARGGVGVVLVFRRGEGSVVVCTTCGRRRACPVCDSTLGYARSGGRDGGADRDAGGAAVEGAGPGAQPPLACPVCGHREPPGRCQECRGEEVVPLAAGAGRLASELARSHPAAEVVRMEGFDARGPATRPALAVMTRGSVVTRPAWLDAPGAPRGQARADVVVVPDADAWLARTAYDAAEDALRLWLAIGRWTQRIVVQTRQPTHPVIQALVRWDPEGFWHREGPRRALWDLPPSAALIALTAPAGQGDAVAAEVATAMPPGVGVLGPDLSGVTLVKAPDLRPALAVLAPLRHAWSTADRRVRVDVDPLL